MFISKQAYIELREDYIKANAIREALTLQVANLNTHLSWMQIRLTEMALERSAMMKRYLNIEVPVPSFEQPHDDPNLNQPIDFRDIGDTMATQLGIGWTGDGTLNYSDELANYIERHNAE